MAGLTGVVALPYQLSIRQLVHRQVIDSVLKQTRKTVKDHLAGNYVQNAVVSLFEQIVRINVKPKWSERRP